MGETVTVTAERNAFLDLYFYSAPGVSMIHHG